VKRHRKIWIAAGLCLATAAVLCLAHYRARAAAGRLKAQLRAQGEKLSIVELIPPAPTDGPNGSAAFLQAAGPLSAILNTLVPDAMAMTKPGRARVAFSQAVLPTADSTNVWPELGARLDELRGGFEELESSLASPEFRFRVNYQQGFAVLLPHLASLKRAIRSLSAETLYRLHKHQTEPALIALQATTRIPVRFRDEPLPISQLIRHALVAIAASTTWEALQYPDWNDPQLAAVQSTWEALNVLAEVPPALAMERACVLEEFENCRESLRRLDRIWGNGGKTPLDDLADITTKAMGDPEEGLDQFLDRFPRRWVWRWWTSYSDEIWFLNWSQLHLQSARNLESGIPYTTVSQQVEAQFTRPGETPKSFLISRETADPDYHSAFVRKAATAETQRRMVITAIAIKRYHLRHGQRPAALSALVPEFLSAIPIDPMDGKPLRYQTSSNDEFLLYSIGIDGTDDGGDSKPASPNAKSFFWTTGNDWVWPMPASREDVAKYHEGLDTKRRSSR
jgi:hypothetical protein